MRATEILRGEHRLIEQVLACLEAMAARAADEGELDTASARQALDFFRTFADGCHHRKEENHLFPALEARGFPRTGGPTGVMRYEHDEGRSCLRAMAAALDRLEAGDEWGVRAFAAHARAYARLLREHIWKEDERLFPMTDRVLSAAEQRALTDSFAAVESREAGPGAREKYLRLAEELADRYGLPHAPYPGCCHPTHPER